MTAFDDTTDPDAPMDDVTDLHIPDNLVQSDQETMSVKTYLNTLFDTLAEGAMHSVQDKNISSSVATSQFLNDVTNALMNDEPDVTEIFLSLVTLYAVLVKNGDLDQVEKVETINESDTPQD